LLLLSQTVVAALLMVLSIVFLVVRAFIKDSAVMKIIGIAIHGLVVVFLIAALGSFDDQCTSKLPQTLLGEDVHYTPGPGSSLVIAALVCNIGIAVVHVLAPATGSDADNRQQPAVANSEPAVANSDCQL
jgi:multisubunit Na+/H+ antiporter MnhC subunit